MQFRAIPLLAAAVFIFSTTAFARVPAPETKVWTIDGESSFATFKVKHMFVLSVSGTIRGISGDVQIHRDNLASAVIRAALDPATIDTGNKKRDAHLKSADYFDVLKHPKIEFKSAKLSQSKDGDWTVHGVLGMRGKTAKILLKVDKISSNTLKNNEKERKTILASGTLNRREYGISGGGKLIGEDVKVSLNIEMLAT